MDFIYAQSADSSVLGVGWGKPLRPEHQLQEPYVDREYESRMRTKEFSRKQEGKIMV